MVLSIGRLLLCAVVIEALAAPIALPPSTTIAAHRARTTDDPSLTCHACFLVTDDGLQLFQRRSGVPLPNASTTKMLTALVVIEEAPSLRDEVVVSARAASVPGGRFSLIAGERFSVRELLLALVITSSNDAAVALAEEIAGTEAAFVEMMNELAGRLGADATHATTSHGLDDSGHLSSARDLATIAGRVLTTEPLASMVATSQVSIEGSERSALLENTNELLETYAGAVGVKTGFTSEAGNVLVAAARRGGLTLIAVAMRSEDAFEDARELLDHGFALARSAVVLEAGAPIGSIIFDPSGTIGVALGEPVTGLADPKARLSIGFEPLPGARPPIAEGEVIGEVTVHLEGRRLATVDATASQAVPVTPRSSWPERFFAGLLATGASFLPGETEV